MQGPIRWFVMFVMVFVVETITFFVMVLLFVFLEWKVSRVTERKRTDEMEESLYCTGLDAIMRK